MDLQHRFACVSHDSDARLIVSANFFRVYFDMNHELRQRKCPVVRFFLGKTRAHSQDQVILFQKSLSCWMFCSFKFYTFFTILSCCASKMVKITLPEGSALETTLLDPN